MEKPGRTFRIQNGFTLLELMAVMAIIAILAAVIAPLIAGTKETSVDSTTLEDAHRVRDAAANFFDQQSEVEVRTSHAVTLTASTTASVGKLVADLTATDFVAAATSSQQRSSRWPEKFITTASTSTFPAVYEMVFTTSGSGNANGKVRRVILLDKEGESVNGQAFLNGHTAIDIDALKTLNLLRQSPSSVEQDTVALSGTLAVPGFLWLFEKTTAAGGASAAGGSREVVVYKLLAAEHIEPTPGATPTQVDLTYQRIF